jgi:hypothetical protein
MLNGNWKYFDDSFVKIINHSQPKTILFYDTALEFYDTVVVFFLYKNKTVSMQLQKIAGKSS